MKNIAAIIALLFSTSVFADEECRKIVEGYEDKDTLFVLCSDLEKYTDEEASAIVKAVFDQYTGPPDEILVYFVSKPELIGATRISGQGITGLYYTHDSILEINPNSKVSRQVKVE